ncbi:MAG: hypothetical protein II525_00545 [Bacteroidales bacterium]|nr:hypothetical protein [Bacteroidales bacterium]
MRIISNRSKRWLAAVLILFAVQMDGVFAQKGVDSSYIAVTGKSYTPNFDKVSPKFEQYIEQNALSIAQKSKDYYTVSYSLVMSKTQFAELKAKLDEWRCETISINETTKFIPQEKKNRRAEIQQLQSSINERNENLLVAEEQGWRERLQKRNESDLEKIREYESEIRELDSKMGCVWIDITLMRELTTPNETQKVKFVNMPGFEYSVFMPENPKAGISATCYNGYMLKYLFTRGKSFVTVGAFKAVDVPSSDLQMYSDLFNFSFGQDFYSRHLGRGGRKFLNLYSGYNVGYLACTGAESTLHNFYVSPAIGIELFKNNFMLFDTKVNYILPFVKNLNMRGLQFAASLNFVF